jgi:hypothetical protein
VATSEVQPPPLCMYRQCACERANRHCPSRIRIGTWARTILPAAVVIAPEASGSVAVAVFGKSAHDLHGLGE